MGLLYEWQLIGHKDSGKTSRGNQQDYHWGTLGQKDQVQKRTLKFDGFWNGHQACLTQLTQSPTALGDKNSGKIPTLQDKYEEMESTNGWPMPLMPSTCQGEKPPHAMSGCGSTRTMGNSITKVRGLDANRTNRTTKTEILTGLRWWNKAEPAGPTIKQSEATQEQEAVGWDLALEGCISKQ